MMKKYLILFIFLAIGLDYTKASDTDTIFKFANDAYATSDFNTSIEVYEQLLNEGFNSVELYYNLGNAYYRQNNLPKAILNYEKAKLIKPHDKDINENLALANNFLVDQIEIIPEFFLKVWIRSIAFLLGYETWSILSLTLFILMIISILIFLFTGKQKLKKFVFTLSFLFFVLSASSFALSHKRYYLQYSKNYAIITAPTINIKSSPDDSGTDLFVLHEGTKVNIEDEVNDWFEIKITDGNKGWISKKDLEVI